MQKIRLQFFGGSGASADLADGPTPGSGGGKDAKYGQPNTPQVPTAPTIRMQIGAKGEKISPAEALRNVNPDRRAIDGMDYEDYTSNCQRCVIAYELNRRGYKVEAEATYEHDTYPSMRRYLKAFKGAKTQDVGATTIKKLDSNVEKTIKEWGNNSRGIVHVTGNGGGHVFNVEYSGGKIRYYDAQTGVKYDPKRVWNNVNKKTVALTRVDNLALADDVRYLVRKQNKRK